MAVVVIMLMGVVELNYIVLWITLVSGTALITGGVLFKTLSCGVPSLLKCIFISYLG